MAPGEDANVFVLTLPIIQDTVITLDSDMENMDAELQTEASGEQYSDDKSEGNNQKKASIWFWL